MGKLEALALLATRGLKGSYVVDHGVHLFGAAHK